MINEMKRFENFSNTILSLSAEGQKEAWEALSAMMTEEELKKVQKQVAWYRLMTDKAYYTAIKNELAKQVWEACNA